MVVNIGNNFLDLFGMRQGGFVSSRLSTLKAGNRIKKMKADVVLKKKSTGETKKFQTD